MSARGSRRGLLRHAAAEKAASGREALPLARRLAPKLELRGFPLFWHAGSADRRMPMVGWFDPGQLIATGLKSAVSALVGERSDRRIVQALAARGDEYYDYTIHYRDAAAGPQPDPAHARAGVWIDYVCDTGDGYNPTYAVAYALAQPRLAIAGGPAGAVETPRADLLVFGGDEVYPAPSREEYQRRLVEPYQQALGDAALAERPHVFAIPGNHDWYDGLSAFTRLFCSDVGGRGFAGWWTRQTRSYFALKLPGNWWLLGSDGQLQQDLDVPQIDYFQRIAEEHMRPGDRVILCTSVPVWIYAHKYRRLGRVFDETDLIYLREHVFAPRGIEVQVQLSGDLHHYRRHEEIAPAPGVPPVQKITAGGGGAFLHPTHDEDVSLLTEEPVEGTPALRFGLKCCYPGLKESWRLAFGNLLFGVKNPKFGIAPAIVYLMTVWLVGAAIGYSGAHGPLHALHLTAYALFSNPGLALWMFALTAAFLMFTDTHSVAYRIVGGLTHAAAHWAAMFYLGWLARWAAGEIAPGSPFLELLVAGPIVFAGGWIAGSVIMGLYLLISLLVFGRHSEEAFSALRIQDYKSFLRLHVAADGTLTIYPVKIRRVPRRWSGIGKATPDSPSLVQPLEPLVAELIEPPVVVPARQSPPSANQVPPAAGQNQISG